jgi:hypothetical protein
MDRLNKIAQKIAAKQQVVDQLKREMDALYQDYDDKWTNMEPQPPRQVEADLEAVAWAKETQWSQANHELRMLNIAHWQEKNQIATSRQKAEQAQQPSGEAQAQQPSGQAQQP